MKFKFMAAIGLAATLFSCDDTTTGIGDFVSDVDKISALADSYKVTSKTEILESVYSRTNKAYLGKYTDPDFGLFTTDFIAQINCPENFRFPDSIIGIDETTLELCYSSYYGDSLATLNVQVDTLNTYINDDGKDKSLYYTSYDPKLYYNTNTKPLAEKSYAAVDYSVSDSTRYDSDYYKNVSIDLGENFCNFVYDKYNENDHSNFKDSYSFINNVLKGFYVHTNQGEGSILYISDIWLRFKICKELRRPSTGAIDSLAYQYIRFSATKEVFMSTRLENSDKLKELAKNDKYTYLKTPAGLCTEVTLPLQEMYDDHKNDTLNSVTMSIKKYKDAGENTGLSPYKMGIPKNVLLLRKSELKDFFEQNKTYDNKTSFLGTYDSSTNSYTFSKLNRLISSIFSEIRNNTEKDENWNKILLVPVSTETDAEGNIIGVSHDMEVNSARLFGGTSEDSEELEIEIVYTNPNMK